MTMHQRDRNAIWLFLVEQGYGYTEIAREYGVSRQRVEQSVKHNGWVPSQELGAPDPIRMMAHIRRTPTCYAIHHIAVALNTSPKKVRECLGALGLLPAVMRLMRCRKRHIRYEQRILPKRQELLTWLRRVATLEGRPPTIEDFVKMPDRPSHMQFYRHFGSWNAAMIEAGFTPRPAGWPVQEKVS